MDGGVEHAPPPFYLPILCILIWPPTVENGIRIHNICLPGGQPSMHLDFSFYQSIHPSNVEMLDLLPPKLSNSNPKFTPLTPRYHEARTEYLKKKTTKTRDKMDLVQNPGKYPRAKRIQAVANLLDILHLGRRNIGHQVGKDRKSVV